MQVLLSRILDRQLRHNTRAKACNGVSASRVRCGTHGRALGRCRPNRANIGGSCRANLGTNSKTRRRCQIWPRGQIWRGCRWLAGGRRAKIGAGGSRLGSRRRRGSGRGRCDVRYLISRKDVTCGRCGRGHVWRCNWACSELGSGQLAIYFSRAHLVFITVRSHGIWAIASGP